MRQILGLVGSWSVSCAGGMGLTGVIGAAALATFAGSANADVKAVEPYFAVLTKDAVPFKCSDGNIYYAVRVLKTGDLLRVDGEGGGWLRAEYPAGVKAYVKADEGTFDDAGKTVRLSKPSKLMSANVTGARPWWYLLEQDLPAGMLLGGAEVVRSADGTVEGYLVMAPAQSRGYVRAETVRRATAEEAAAYKPAEVAKVEAPGSKPAETPATPASAAAAPQSAPSGTPTEITMTPAPVPGGQASQPAPVTPAPAGGAAAGTPAAPAPAVAAAPRPTQRIDDVETLRAMFDRVMQNKGDESEIASVIAEFNRKINSLGDNPRDAQVRTALTSRLEALHLRQEVLETRRSVGAGAAQYDERARSVKIAMEEVERQAIYTIVGRMLPSTVYDGRRGLPLMFRIESADLSSTRTIGYVVPQDGVDLLPKMGKVVGIIGEAKFDPALGLNIVAPRRVEVLNMVGGRFQVVPDSSGSQPPVQPGTLPGSASTQPATQPATTPAGTPVQPVSPPTASGDSPDMNK